MTIKVITRFTNGKVLMFYKVSVKNFVYNMSDAFCFAYKKIKEICSKYRIIKFFLHLNLTDTDSSSFSHVFVCFDHCSIKELLAGNIIFEVLINSKILERLDTSHQCWKQFHNIHKPELYKQAGLCWIESIDNPNTITITINPKEDFEKFKDKNLNKKH